MSGFDDVNMRSGEYTEKCIDGLQHISKIDMARGERTCIKCGWVISDKIISAEGSETRSYMWEQFLLKKHTGPRLISPLPELQMPTTIDKRIPIKQALYRAMIWNGYTWKERMLIRGSFEICRMTDLLGLPSRIQTQAVYLFRKAFEIHLMKGRSVSTITTAILYYVCGTEQTPRTLSEIVSTSDCTVHGCIQAYRILLSALQLSSPLRSPYFLVSKYISSLGLSHIIESIVNSILRQYEQKYTFSGKDPKGLVSAAIYLACQKEDQKISQCQIAQIVGITDVTLRNRMKLMNQFINIPIKKGENRGGKNKKCGKTLSF
jgi:transcription initiation factor TFIIB